MNEEKDEPALSEHFERLLRGVPSFLLRFVLTPWRLLRRQTSLYQAGDATPPFTFLFLSCALASRTLSTAVHPHRDWMVLFRRIQENVATDLIGLLRLTLPMALAILVCCAALEKLSNWGGSDRLRRTAFLSYAPACGMLAVFALSVLMAWADYSLRGGFPDMEERVALGRRVEVACLVLFGLCLGIAYRVAGAVLRQWYWRVVLAAALLASVYASFVVGSRFEALPKLAEGPRRPVIPLTLVETYCERTENGIEATFKLLVENPDPSPMTVLDRGTGRREEYDEGLDLVLNWPQLAWGCRPKGGVERLRIADSPNGTAPFFVVPAWGRSWVALKATLDDETAEVLHLYAAKPDGVRIKLPFVRGDVPGRANNPMWESVPFSTIDGCLGAD